jgi:hypothetical protein
MGLLGMRSRLVTAVHCFGSEEVAQFPLDDLAVIIGRQSVHEP